MFAPPLDFRSGWYAAVKNAHVRQWLFSCEPPTPAELILVREHRPFILECSITKNVKLYGQCHRLSDGSVLGFVMTHDASNGEVPLLGEQDPAYKNNRYMVTRFAAYTVDGRLASMEFAWMSSGVLSIRYHPYNMLSAVNFVNYHVFAFSSVDATFLSVMAHESSPPVDFVHGRFEDMPLLRPWYTMIFMDVCFQGPCGICDTRGEVQCGCPSPMKRRRFDLNTRGMFGTRTRPTYPVYNEVITFFSTMRNASSLLYNITVTSPGSKEVMFSGIVPFKFTLINTVLSHTVLQQFLTFAGSSAGDPLRLAIGFSTNNDSQDSPEESFDFLVNSDTSNNSPPSPAIIVGESPAGCRSSSPEDRGITIAPVSAGAVLDSSRLSPTFEEVEEVLDGLMPAFSVDVPDVASRSSSPDVPVTLVSTPPLVPSSDDIEAVAELGESTPAVNSTDVTNKPQPRLKRKLSSDSSNRDRQFATNVVNVEVKPLNRAETNGSGAGCPVGQVRCRTVPPGRTANNAALPENARLYTCEICGKEIVGKKSNLTRHIASVHDKVLNFSCNVVGCGRKFPSKHNLERHKRSMHMRQPAIRTAYPK